MWVAFCQPTHHFSAGQRKITSSATHSPATSTCLSTPSRLEEIIAAQPQPEDEGSHGRGGLIGSHAAAAAHAAAALCMREEEEDRRADEAARMARMRRDLSCMQDAVAALEAQQVVQAAQGRQQHEAGAAAAQRLSALELQVFGSGGAVADAGWTVPPLDQAAAAAAASGRSLAGRSSSGGGGAIAERLAGVEGLVVKTLQEAERGKVGRVWSRGRRLVDVLAVQQRQANGPISSTATRPPSVQEERANLLTKLRRLEARVTEQLGGVREETARVGFGWWLQ